MTALMFAVQHGYFDIIQMFVSNTATNLLIRDSVSMYHPSENVRCDILFSLLVTAT